MKLIVLDDGIRKFNNNFKSGCWMILYYADGCGHCEMFKPTWNSFKNQNTYKKLNIAEIPVESLNLLDDDHHIMGFPTVKMYKNGVSKGTFEGERTIEKLNSFANMNMEKLTNKNIVKIRNKVKKNSNSLKDKRNRKSKKSKKKKRI